MVAKAFCLMHCMYLASSVVVLTLSNQVLHSLSQARGILWPPFLDIGGALQLSKHTKSSGERIALHFI